MAEMEMEKEMEGGEQGDVTELIQAVGDGLMQLSQIIGKNPATTPQDTESMAKIMEMYQTLVEKQLAAGPGQNPEEPDLGPKEIPMEGKGIPMGPQMRQ